MRSIFRLLIMVMILSLSACSHWREAYFDDGMDEVTQEEVEKKLGRPLRVKTSALNDETLVTYRFALTYSELHPMGFKQVGQGITNTANFAASLIGKGSDQAQVGEKPECIHYILTFDKSNVLKKWKRENCADSPL